MTTHNNRPDIVPPDWVCKPCQQCGLGTWYPPGAEKAAADCGTPFAVVCSAKCTFEFTQKMLARSGE